MPEIGDIKRAKELGYKHKSYKYVYHACEICGKERWVYLRKGEPANKWCGDCSRKMVSQTRRDYSGDQAPNWRGGIYHSPRGYIFISKPEHPHATCKGYVMRSRLVLEEKLGRYLWPDCEPHHINGIKDDDRPENLEELTHSQHRSIENRRRAK